MRLWFAGPARHHHAQSLQAIRDSGKQPRNILFLCHGNICRSPVAEKLCQRLMPHAEVASAGFYAEENRQTPPNVQRAAQTLGVDLGAWSSRRVSQELVARSDLVVLLDLGNFRDYRRAFPNDLAKVAFLGLFLDTPQTDIADPYGKPEDETLEIVRLIDAAVHAMARQLN
jgi:protein-tyrosine phosphatase